MTFSCVDCTTCGKCYEKQSTCEQCGGEIHLLDEACTSCGEPITEEMREQAKKKYIDRRREERDAVLRFAAAAKKRQEEADAARPKYPWED